MLPGPGVVLQEVRGGARGCLRGPPGILCHAEGACPVACELECLVRFHASACEAGRSLCRRPLHAARVVWVGHLANASRDDPQIKERKDLDVVASGNEYKRAPLLTDATFVFAVVKAWKNSRVRSLRRRPCLHFP